MLAVVAGNQRIATSRGPQVSHPGCKINQCYDPHITKRGFRFRSRMKILCPSGEIQSSRCFCLGLETLPRSPTFLALLCILLECFCLVGKCSCMVIILTWMEKGMQVCTESSVGEKQIHFLACATLNHTRTMFV